MNNTTKAKCRVCKRDFIKRTRSTGYKLKDGVRSANAVTCGRKECQRSNLKILRRELYLRKRDNEMKRSLERYRKFYILEKDYINARRRERYAANVEAIRLKRRVKKLVKK